MDAYCHRSVQLQVCLILRQTIVRIVKSIDEMSNWESDVWLTVHRSSMWNKKPTRCHLVLYLFLLYKLLNMFRATLRSSSGADDLVLCVHWGVRSTCATYSPMDTQPANRI